MSPSQNLWSLLETSNTLYHIIVDKDGNYTYANEYFRKVFTEPGKDIIGSSFFDGILPEDVELCRQAIADCLLDPEKRVTVSVRKAGAYGAYYWIHCEWASMIRFPNLLLTVQFVGYDISEAKKNSTTLSQAKKLEYIIRQNEHRWMTALEGSNQGLFDWDMRTNEVYYSGRLKKMLGYEEHEMPNTLEAWEQRIHPEDKLQVMKDIEIHGNSADPYYENIYRIICKDGSYKWIMGRGMVTSKSAEGKPLRMIGTHTDITHLKEAEQRIAQSEERLAKAQRMAHLGSWEFDLRDGTMFWSDEVYYLLGLDKTRVQAGRETLFRYIHPEDRHLFEKYEATMFLDKKPLQIIHRIIRPDGVIKYMEAIGEPVLNEKGDLIMIRGTVQDITSKIEAENSVRISEEKYKLLFISNPQPMWVYDDQTLQFLEVNEAAVQHYGYSEEEFYSMTLKDIRPKEDIPLLLMDVQGKKEDLPPTYKRGYWQHYKKNGELIFVEIKSHSIDYVGRSARLVLSSDVTDKVIAEQKLYESNLRFRYAAKASSDVIWDYDIVQEKLDIGEGFEKLFGYKLSELKQELGDWTEHIYPDDKAGVIRKFNEWVFESDEEQWTEQYRYSRADGSIAIVMDRWIVLRDQRGKPLRVIGAMTDLTETKKLEAELAEQKVLQQKRITEATIQVQEQEREQIGKELHDNINQILTTTKLYLDMALNDEEIRDELLKRSHLNVSKAIEEIRHLTKTLVPPSLGDIGIKEAVAEMIEHLNLAQKLKINLKTSGLRSVSIPGPLKLMTFRIIQEQVHNILKHSKATEVNIRLEIAKKVLSIMIADNGKGFDPSKKTKGIGLSNISSRAELHNGKVMIDSAPGAGCVLKVIIPL
jgi:PAS domain S-box-containing protein